MGTHTRRPTSKASITLEMARNRFILLLDKSGVHYTEGDVPTLLPPAVRVAFMEYMNAREQLRQLHYEEVEPNTPLSQLVIPALKLDDLATAK